MAQSIINPNKSETQQNSRMSYNIYVCIILLDNGCTYPIVQVFDPIDIQARDLWFHSQVQYPLEYPMFVCL